MIIFLCVTTVQLTDQLKTQDTKVDLNSSSIKEDANRMKITDGIKEGSSVL